MSILGIRFPALLLGASLMAPRTVHAQWTAQASGTTAEFRGLSVVSPTVAWVSGMRGLVAHTLDGGGHWILDTVATASKLDLRSIAATSARVAHAMSIGDSSRIFRTTDGGRSWTQQFISLKKGSFFDAIRFWDEKHGIAVSDPVDGKFLLVTTSDGGDTWQEISSAAIPHALPAEGAFAASGSALAVWGKSDVWFVTGGAAVARIYHSPDRGRSWMVHDTPLRVGAASTGVFSVAFRDAKHGAIAGGDYAKPRLAGRNLALTSDGGRTWTLVDSATSPAGFRSAVAFVPGTAGKRLIATGLSGTDLSADGGKTWTPMDTVAYNSVVMSGNVAYATGPRGRVARWVAR
ncbi:MAG: glycosyl hydrolase [Gemmatimonadetes bacterium]|nr:glycosyl hydrolase [Gemmatimonadota bacterium]